MGAEPGSCWANAFLSTLPTAVSGSRSTVITWSGALVGGESALLEKGGKFPGAGCLAWADEERHRLFAPLGIWSADQCRRGNRGVGE
jgi:hypothetical protein